MGGPAYGDWTRPSRSGSEREGPHDSAHLHDSASLNDDAVATDAPAGHDAAAERFPRLRASAPTETTAIPEREVARRGGSDERSTDTDLEALSTTGTIGGRAATRAERQAAEEARIRARKESGSAASGLGEGRRSLRRAALGLVAVAVVALAVLGVYSFESPHTREAAAQQTPGSDSAAASVPVDQPVPGVGDLPALSTGSVPATPSGPAAPIRVPVTVLNATDVNGLAAGVSDALKSGGWPTAPVGSYVRKDVAVSTVYFTQGDENQHQAALQLVAQFPQLQGPVPRFFDVPGNAAPGLVVIATGDWKP